MRKRSKSKIKWNKNHKRKRKSYLLPLPNCIDVAHKAKCQNAKKSKPTHLLIPKTKSTDTFQKQRIEKSSIKNRKVVMKTKRKSQVETRKRN